MPAQYDIDGPSCTFRIIVHGTLVLVVAVVVLAGAEEAVSAKTQHRESESGKQENIRQLREWSKRKVAD
jgi:hypothetical protein